MAVLTTEEPQVVRTAAEEHTDRGSSVPPTGDPDVVTEEQVLREELGARLAEARQKIAAANTPWWGKATPLSVAVVGGALTLTGSIGAALFSGHNLLKQESIRAREALGVEQEKNEAALIIQAVSTSDPIRAQRNVLFFIESGFFGEQSEKIKQALGKFGPVLPASRGDPPATADDYEKDFWLARVNSTRMPTMDNLVERLAAAKERCQRVGEQSNTPWYIVAIIWERETSGSLKAHVHNGDPLTARTTHEPVGGPAIWPPPDDQDMWTYSAVDAMKYFHFDNTNNESLGSLLERLELLNSRDYKALGVFSPSLWSGTDLYTRGKYVASGVFDPNVVSDEIGIVALLRRLHELGKIDLRGLRSTATAPRQ